MKILHLSAFDEEGGAARAAGRLHRELLLKGYDSWLAVRHKSGDRKNVIRCGIKGKVGKAISALRPYIDALPLAFYRNKKNTPWNITWLPNQLERLYTNNSPDIVHAHWLGTGFLPLRNLSKINAQIVWTLHDTWPFTGGCHIINNCSAFKNSCGKCPQLGSSYNYDLSRLGWHRKRHLYKKNKPIFVAPSRWIAEQAKSSSLLSGFQIEVIPNGLDTNIFQPIDKKLARDLLGLPHDKKVILFGAMSATNDLNKGFEKLKKALTHLKQSNLDCEIELVVFGSSEPMDKPDLGFKVTYLGRFHDDISLATVYSAADVMCVPSIQESFGQTATESMSCGTPVIAFATSGLMDIIEHGVTGYLAKPYDEIDFAKGIESLIMDKSVLKEMSISSRNKVVECFDISIVTSKYVDLYRKILPE